MKTITKQVSRQIMQYCKSLNPKLDWSNYNVDNVIVTEILEAGIEKYEEGLYERNIEYVDFLIEQAVTNTKEHFAEYDQDMIADIARDHIVVDLDIKTLLRRMGNLTCLIYAYSNYDCCNSFDRYEKEGYIYEVFQRIRHGVRLKDYMYEFHNGAYGGSLFCFVFKTTVLNYFELEKMMNTSQKIYIPKDTQFGFFSSFQGAGSVFEKVTKNGTWLSIKGDTKYDTFGIVTDISQSYSIRQTYGCTDFIKEININKIKFS